MFALRLFLKPTHMFFHNLQVLQQRKLMLKKNIAIAVDSLRDLDATLSAISADDYNQMIDNTIQMNNKLKRGHYLRKAVLRALETITIHE